MLFPKKDYFFHSQHCLGACSYSIGSRWGPTGFPQPFCHAHCCCPHSVHIQAMMWVTQSHSKPSVLAFIIFFIPYSTLFLLVTNSSLIGLIPPNKREAMSFTGNPANYPWLVKSWILEKCLQPSFYWTRIRNNTLNICLFTLTLHQGHFSSP